MTLEPIALGIIESGASFNNRHSPMHNPDIIPSPGVIGLSFEEIGSEVSYMAYAYDTTWKWTRDQQRVEQLPMTVYAPIIKIHWGNSKNIMPEWIMFDNEKG